MMRFIPVENEFEIRRYPLGELIVEGDYYKVEKEYNKIYQKYNLETHLYFIVFYNKSKDIYKMYELKL